jgi:membrane protein DedA with SNARE-associated domain
MNPAVVFLQKWGYPAVALLLMTGFGSPIPEDLVLLASGYLISAEVFSWAGAVPVSIAGVLVSDCILFWLGTRVKQRHSMFIRRLVLPGEDSSGRWSRFGDVSVCLARLVPGTRAITFLGAGIRRMNFGRFLLLDACGAVISVSLLLAAGFWMGGAIGGLDRILQYVSQTVFIALIVIACAVMVWRFSKKAVSPRR